MTTELVTAEQLEAVAVKWCKDPKVEHHLRQMGIRFETAQIPMEQIDLDGSAERQVRIGKRINDDWVLDYAIAMQNGAVFPFSIINRDRRNVYSIWSGNHRLHAAKLIHTVTIDAYVVEVKDARTADILSRVVNTWEGRRLSRDEILLQAKYLIQEHSLDTDEVAGMVSIKPEVITNYMRGADVADKIQAQGVNPSSISRTLLMRMSPLRSNLNILREASRIIVEKLLSYEETITMIDEVKEEKTELQQQAILAKWEKVGIERRSKPNLPLANKLRSAVRQRLLAKLNGFSKFIARYETIEQLQIYEATDLKRVTTHWNTIQRRMNKILSTVNGKEGA